MFEVTTHLDSAAEIINHLIVQHTLHLESLNVLMEHVSACSPNSAKQGMKRQISPCSPKSIRRPPSICTKLGLKRDDTPCSPKLDDNRLHESVLDTTTQSCQNNADISASLETMEEKVVSSYSAVVTDACDSSRSVKLKKSHAQIWSTQTLSKLETQGRLEEARGMRILCPSLYGEAEPERTGILAQMVLSDKFELVVSGIILLYVLFTIVETNWVLSKGADNPPVVLWVLEVVFESAYLLEVTLRILVHRLFYLCNDDKWWNIFDLIMVGSTVADHVMTHITNGQSNPLFLRALRIAKIARRVFRMVRLTRYISDLRLMVKCIIGSLLSLTWCVFLLAGFTLAYAIFFGQQFAIFLTTEGPNLSPDQVLDIRENFGSVQIATFTLLKSISGGVNWGEVYPIIGSLGLANSLVFLSYIIMVWLSLSNIITSIFLDKAMTLAQPEVHTRALRNFKNTLSAARELADLFKMISGKSENISMEQLQTCLEDVRTASFFQSHGLDITDVESFVELLTDSGAHGVVNLETFVTACMSLKGPARSIDVLTLKQKILGVEEMIKQLFYKEIPDYECG